MDLRHSDSIHFSSFPDDHNKNGIGVDPNRMLDLGTATDDEPIDDLEFGDDLLNHPSSPQTAANDLGSGRRIAHGRLFVLRRYAVKTAGIVAAFWLLFMLWSIFDQDWPSKCRATVPSAPILFGEVSDGVGQEMKNQLMSADRIVKKPYYFMHSGDGDYLALGWGRKSIGISSIGDLGASEGLNVSTGCITDAVRQSFNFPSHNHTKSVSTCSSGSKAYYPSLYCDEWMGASQDKHQQQQPAWTVWDVVPRWFSGAREYGRDAELEFKTRDASWTIVGIAVWHFCNEHYGPDAEREFKTREEDFGVAVGRSQNTIYTEICYLLSLDSADLQDVRMFSENEHLKQRPLVFIAPPFLSGRLSCRHFPGKVGLIPALNYKQSNHCDMDAKAELQRQVAQYSRRFPDQSVVFLLAGGHYNSAVVHELWRKDPAMYRKDVVISIGSVLDTMAGRGTRDYNKDWETNCRKSHTMFPPDVIKDRCEKFGYKPDPNNDFSDNCSLK